MSNSAVSYCHSLRVLGGSIIIKRNVRKCLNHKCCIKLSQLEGTWRAYHNHKQCHKVPQAQVMYRTVTIRGYLEGVSQSKAMSDRAAITVLYQTVTIRGYLEGVSQSKAMSESATITVLYRIVTIRGYLEGVSQSKSMLESARITGVVSNYHN